MDLLRQAESPGGRHQRTRKYAAGADRIARRREPRQTHEATIEAIRLAGRLEALPLDPVYSGKGLAGLIALIRQGRWRKDENVIFLHTGGAPALFAYQSALSI